MQRGGSTFTSNRRMRPEAMVRDTEGYEFCYACLCD